MNSIFTRHTHTRGDFLPDLCGVQAVFTLILVGELLALALTLAASGVTHFDWYAFGSMSFLIQWITLSSAAVLCPLRPWLGRQSSYVAGTVSYCIVLSITLAFSVLGAWGLSGELRLRVDQVLTHMLMSAVFSGIALRYLYIQAQLKHKKQSELEARIQALQSRIRPHFLFNSMNSIASLITIDPEVAEKMVVDLSQLFRASLKESGKVPLAEELSLCERFVGIEQLRLGERLQVVWDIQVASPEAEIPSLLLQPLIENAIYHGIQPIPEGGVVHVVAKEDAEYIRISVTNPFCDNPVEDYQGHGMALENIGHRLSAYYGNDAKLKSERHDDRYTVTVEYPLHSDEDVISGGE